MAIQIRCFKCDRQFLMRSDNAEALAIEFDNHLIKVICPQCGYSNYEFLLTDESRFGKTFAGSVGAEHQQVINFDQTDVELADADENWSAVDQMVFDFYQDHLPEVSGTYCPVPVLDNQGRAIGVYKVIGQPSPEVYERMFKPDKYRDSVPNTLGRDQCPGDALDEVSATEPADVGGIFGGVTMPEK